MTEVTPTPMGASKRKAAVFAWLLLFSAVGVDLVLLRSYEFLPWVSFIPKYESTIVVPKEPPFDIGSTRSAEHVTLVMVDGLRLDVSRTLPTLNALRQEGASVDTHALFPSFTRPGIATMLSGCGPREHGYMSNFSSHKPLVPSIMDTAKEAGLKTRFLYALCEFPAPPIWDKAFDLAEPLSATGTLTLDSPSFTFVYVRQPDKAGHASGGASEEYRKAALEADSIVARIRAGMDLTKETLVVATDHGHLDRGGHGGHDVVVETIPLIFAGPGIRKGKVVAETAFTDLRDIAPTICALLGLPVPKATTGRVLDEGS